MCRKAEQGTYTVTLTYDQSVSWMGTTEKKTATANIELTDSQGTPDYSIRSLTTSTNVQTAHQVALDCIQTASEDTIMDCTVTGSSQPGVSTIVKSGEQIHISSVKIRSTVLIKNQQKVYVDYIIPIGKTFTNR